MPLILASCIIFLYFFLLSPFCLAADKTPAEDRKEESLLEFLTGETPPDQLFLGMFTLHFNDKSRRIRNWKQNLVALQYGNVFGGTFENSYFKQCWTLGTSRELYASAASENWNVSAGYRVGGIYGYTKEDEAPLSDISPIVPLVALYADTTFREGLGFELMLTTSLSLDFYYRF